MPHCVSVVLWGPIVYPLHSDVPLCLYWDPVALWGPIVSPLQRNPYSPTVHYGVLLCPCCTMGSHCESIHYMLQSHCEPTALWGPIMSLCPHCITWSPYVPIALWGPVVSLLGSICTMRSRCVPIALWGPIVSPLHCGVPTMCQSLLCMRGPTLWGSPTSPLHCGVPLCPYCTKVPMVHNRVPIVSPLHYGVVSVSHSTEVPMATGEGGGSPLCTVGSL